MSKLSPMMQQYFNIKEKHKDSILFFRLGDFYEMFFDDAKLASKELEIALTGRDCGTEKRAPMCGVPYHSSEGYISKLVERGYKVAICEQVEDAASAKGIVKREIVRVITPGTVLESSMLDESKNNYISCCYAEGNKIGLCFCDISTGQLFATQIEGKDASDNMKNHLGSYNPREILIGGDIVKIKGLADFIKEKLDAGLEMLEDEKFSFKESSNLIKEHFGEDQFVKINDDKQLVSSLGALINYLRQTQITGLERINEIQIFSNNHFVNLDYNTQRNLELTQTMRNKEKRGSLLWVIDKTKTAMGKRLIRSWLEKPLQNIGLIINRQSAVEELFNNTVQRLELARELFGVFDIERIMTKIVYGSANGRDLRALASATETLPEISELISDSKSTLLKETFNDLDTLQDIKKAIDNSIVEEPPFSTREGGMIKKGYNAELDELNSIMTDSTSTLTKIETEQKKLTNIPNLKVGYNRVFGYYIEVTNSYKDNVPEHYVRKQTLTNCERYITDELKKLEGVIMGAKEKAIALEAALFEKVCKQISEDLNRIQKTAHAVAKLDVLCSMANVAADNNYTKPEVNMSDDIILEDSRHPVVELLLKGAPFVPNNVKLNCNNDRVNIITGPNMAGKSTYMRQVALIVLMAQMGSFVPASKATIGIVDSIFTRVGASDDLAAGQSTFMVEMSEVAHIVKNATKKSLLILDEIGRGTSTFDGMSIARAVVEYAADKNKLGAKTLFATHYHELTELEELIDGVKNYNIAVKKRGDDITFLRRIVPGGADDSYGIEVAKLAGVPEWITSRSKKILETLEENDKNKVENYSVSSQSQETNEPKEQLLLIDNKNEKISKKLSNTDIDTLTPIEAMNLLYELKNLL